MTIRDFLLTGGASEIAEAVDMPKKVEVVKGNKKLGAAVRDVYQVDKLEPFENGSKLFMTRLRGQASSKRKLVLFVRYAKHLEKDEFNASRGDGINKVKFRVVKRRQVTEDVETPLTLRQERRLREAVEAEGQILAEAKGLKI